MKTYRLAMTALGLRRGDTFSSDDPRWMDHVKAGVLTVVGEEPANERRGIEIVVVPDPDEEVDLT